MRVIVIVLSVILSGFSFVALNMGIRVVEKMPVEGPWYAAEAVLCVLLAVGMAGASVCVAKEAFDE